MSPMDMLLVGMLWIAITASVIFVALYIEEKKK